MEDREKGNVNYTSIKDNSKSGFIKSVLHCVNFFTNVILILTAIVCFIYAYQFPLGAYQLHVILCVLGVSIQFI